MNAISDNPGTAPADRSAPSFAPTLSNLVPLAVLVIGSVIIFLPTIIFVATTSWNSETGGHGPIVFATAMWLFFRLWPEAAKVAATPPTWRVVLLLLIFVPAYVIARITQIVEMEGFLMYGCLLTAIYSAIGAAAMRRLWFPFVYFAFIFPPPETLVAIVTVPLKIWLSHFAVMILQLCGYPVGNAGVSIFIGQYSLLVAAACSGLNSLISLAAISLFYIYMRHQAEYKYALFLVLLTIPVAMVANLIRVLTLILLTYYAGNAAGEGFLHNFAGILMFTVAVVTMFGVDALAKPLWERLFGKADAARDNPFFGM